MNNCNYPPGADTKDAPWNQHDHKGLEFEVTISQSLSKTTIVITTDYKEEEDYDDCLNQKVSISNTEETNWHEAYNSCHFEPYELINFLKNILATGKLPSEERRKHLIEECKNWVVDETEVCL